MTLIYNDSWVVKVDIHTTTDKYVFAEVTDAIGTSVLHVSSGKGDAIRKLSQALIALLPNAVANFSYVNYKGVQAERSAFIKSFKYTATPYHPDTQWVVEGFDIEKKATRSYAMADIIH